MQTCIIYKAILQQSFFDRGPTELKLSTHSWQQLQRQKPVHKKYPRSPAMRVHLTVNPWRVLITCIQGNAWVRSKLQLLSIAAATSQPSMRCGVHPSINSTAMNTRIKIKPSNSNTPQPLVMAGCVIEDVTRFRCAGAGHMNGQPSQGRTVAKTLKNCN